jgi:hypothetical protein
MIKKTEYDLQAEKFLDDTGTILTSYYTGTRPYFDGDKEPRDVYSVTLTRGKKSYTFSFGDSIANSKKIRYGEAYRTKLKAYDVLTCLTKYEPADNIDDFMADYGYEKASVAIKVYNAVKAEYKGLTELYNDDEMALLADIQ